jgi:hypothetical protein
MTIAHQIRPDNDIIFVQSGMAYSYEVHYSVPALPLRGCAYGSLLPGVSTRGRQGLMQAAGGGRVEWWEDGTAEEGRI